MDRRIKGVLGILLLLLGVGFYAYPACTELSVKLRTDEIIEQISQNQSQSGERDAEDTRPFMLEYNRSLFEKGQALTDAWSYMQHPDFPQATGDTAEAAGYLEIPDMDLKIPLYLGASSEHLAKGAAVLSQTSMPIGGVNSNCVIAGHRGYRGAPFFRDIEKLQPGSFVYLVNFWERLTYQVSEIRIILPDEVGAVAIREGKDLVTLLTCHPYMGQGKYRYLVYCEWAETSGETTKQAEDSLEPLHGEEEKGKPVDSGEVQEAKTRVTNQKSASETRIIAELTIRRAILAAAAVTAAVRCRRRKRKDRIT